MNKVLKTLFMNIDDNVNELNVVKSNFYNLNIVQFSQF